MKAFLFPGQGSQVVGMGRDIAEAYSACDEVFEKGNKIVGYDIRQICFDGPAERLNSTVVSQPAIFITCAAILEIVWGSGNSQLACCDVTAGLSLGEYTALYAAGLISFEDALVLVKKRGEAMQAAADASDGAMISIIGLDKEKVEQLCSEAAQGELLKPVNFNCPGQIVISGSIRACERAAELAEKYGAIKAVKLAVAGAFHTEMMAQAAEALSQALQGCEISDPEEVKVIANITGEYYGGSAEIREGLVRQLVEPILWQKCMERLIADGVEEFYEIGPQRVLTGLMKRIDRKQRVTNISNLKSLNEVLEKV